MGKNGLSNTKTPRRNVESITRGESGALGPTVQQRMASGKALRKRIPRTSYAKSILPSDRPDPIELLKNADRERLPELLPIRYGRMRQSPFAFFRGAAALMAAADPPVPLRLKARFNSIHWTQQASSAMRIL